MSVSELARADVVVVGGGNAGICAAISACEERASVLLLERDSENVRGGNSKYTRNIRCAHGGHAESAESYTEGELLEDLVGVTGDDIDLELAKFTIHESRTAPEWMERNGIFWQPALRGTLQLARTNRFFLGGGKALINSYYRRATAMGATLRYRAKVIGLETGRGGLRVSIDLAGEIATVQAGAIVAAAGGLESNIEWLKRHWGPGAENFVIRGTGSNDGLVLNILLGLGALERGNPKGFHAVAVDARAPRNDGGIVTRVDSIPFGIVVNREGRRFHDEGEDLWPKRYAVWGRLIAEQPGQIAYSIFDSRVRGKFIPPAYPAIVAGSIEEIARALGLDPRNLTATVDDFNRHATKHRGYDPSRLDGVSAEGLGLPKSNWALPIDTPPFCAYPLRPGITFTYYGVAVDSRARVLNKDGGPLPGTYAAGEIMAGNILLRGYLGGFGMTIGTVFGRIAGREAAQYAQAN